MVIFFIILVALPFKAGTWIERKKDFSRNICSLAKAIARLNCLPPAKAGGNKSIDNEAYIILLSINSIEK
jgi:hypothetical protein